MQTILSKLKNIYKIAFLILCICREAKSIEINKEDLANFEKKINIFFEKSSIPGAAISIITTQDDIIYNTYGFKSTHKKKKINENTVFRICSLSKPIISYLVYLLEKENKDKINLNSNIADYIPNIVVANKKFTKELQVFHLLNQCSGLKEYSSEIHAYRKQSQQNLFNTLRFAKIISKPGKKFSYQNVLFSLMATIISKSQNENFNDIIRKKVFTPLNMHDTILSEQKFKNHDNLAKAHLFNGKVKKNYIVTPKSYYYNILSAGGISSSLRDMSNFLRQILVEFDTGNMSVNYLFKYAVCANRKIRKLEYRPYNKKFYKNINYWKYGLGWYLESYKKHNFIFHCGALKGYRSCMMFDPEKKIGLVILTNSNRGSKFIRTIRHCFAEFILGIKLKSNVE